MKLQAETTKRRAAEAQAAAQSELAQQPARSYLEVPGAEAPGAEQPGPRTFKEKTVPPAPAPAPAPAVSVVAIQSASRKAAPLPKPPVTALAAKLGAMDWGCPCHTPHVPRYLP